MKYRIKLGVSDTSNRVNFDVEMDTFFKQEQWENLSEEQKREAIQEWVDEDVNPPYWIVEEIEKL